MTVAMKHARNMLLGKRAKVLAVWVCLLGHAVPVAAETRIKIASGGASDYTIVIPDDVDAAMIRRSAHLLRHAIRESAGVELPIVAESDLGPGVPAIYLGRTRAAMSAGLPLDEMEGWAHHNRTVGRDIFLAGNDTRLDWHPSHRLREQSGSLKAVVSFLEEQLGARFLLPGDYGRRFPGREPLAVAADMDRAWAPLLDHAHSSSHGDEAFHAAMNWFSQRPVYGSAHSYYRAVPEREYGDSNPEYFALIAGIRTPRGGHLCISNPEVQELMLRHMEQMFDTGYEAYVLGQTDGYQPCRCDGCEALHPDRGERLWIVHRKLAEAMQERRPGKSVILLVYADTREPPRSFDAFPENVMLQMVFSPARFEELFQPWRAFDVPKMAYLNVWGSWQMTGFAPVRTPRWTVEMVRHLFENDVRGLYLTGGFISASNYGMAGPVYYTLRKAVGDPSREADDLFEEYVAGLFGEAAAPMRAFYRAMYTRLEDYTPPAPVAGAGRRGRSLGTPEDFYCHFFPPDTLDEMTRSLERAKEMARDEKVRASIRMVELEFDYIRSIASVYHVYRAYRAVPNQTTFDQVAAAVAGHWRLVEGLYDENNRFREALPGGLPALFALRPKDLVLTGGRGQIGRRPPFNWDFERMREQGILPGAEPIRRIDVTRVDGWEIDGRIDKPEWRDIPFHMLSEIGLGAVKNATRFKVAWDDRALYVGFENEVDSPEIFDALRTTGHDGRAWAQECIEILLDPFGDRERHVQLVLSPAPDSTYDARYGYIDDPEHPLYGRGESTWVGRWERAFHIDREGRRWTAEFSIPFETLETETPTPGSLWTANFMRAEFEGGVKGTGSATSDVYSAWSPNLRSRDFHDRTSFGELIFR